MILPAPIFFSNRTFLLYSICYLTDYDCFTIIISCFRKLTLSPNCKYQEKTISDVVYEKRPFEYEERKTSLQEAGKEWENLTQEFRSLVLNEAGLQRAEEGHFPDAIALWGEASSSGCAKSHYNLAVCYENGNGCKKDLKEVRNLPTVIIALLIIWTDGCRQLLREGNVFTSVCLSTEGVYPSMHLGGGVCIH